jgi:hypothetical protein
MRGIVSAMTLRLSIPMILQVILYLFVYYLQSFMYLSVVNCIYLPFSICLSVVIQVNTSLLHSYPYFPVSRDFLAAPLYQTTTQTQDFNISEM